MDPLPIHTIIAENQSYYPIYYRDLQKRRRRFIKLEEHSRLSFSFLFRFASPYADFDLMPSLIKCDFNQVFVKILNYSSIELRLDKRLNLFANNHLLQFIFKNSCHLLIYSVLRFSHIACVEQNEEDASKPLRRFFLSKIGNSYEVTNFLYDEYSINMKEKNKLFTQISYPVLDHNFISINPDLISLAKKIGPEADLTKEPAIIKFYPRKNTATLIIINYTNENITYNIYKQIFINRKNITNLFQRNAFLIAYYLVDHKEVMCLDIKYEGLQNHFLKIYTKLVWNIVGKIEILDVFQQIHYNMAFKRLWTGKYDENSIFHNLPMEILSYIAVKYINVLQ